MRNKCIAHENNHVLTYVGVINPCNRKNKNWQIIFLFFFLLLDVYIHFLKAFGRFLSYRLVCYIVS